MKKNSLIYSSQVPGKAGSSCLVYGGRNWGFQRFRKWPEVTQLRSGVTASIQICAYCPSHWMSGGTGSWDEPYGMRRRESWNDWSTASPGKSFGGRALGRRLDVHLGNDAGRWWGARCQRALCSNLRTLGLWLVEKPLIFWEQGSCLLGGVHQKGLIPKWHLQRLDEG